MNPNRNGNSKLYNKTPPLKSQNLFGKMLTTFTFSDMNELKNKLSKVQNDGDQTNDTQIKSRPSSPIYVQNDQKSKRKTKQTTQTTQTQTDTRVYDRSKGIMSSINATLSRSKIDRGRSQNRTVYNGYQTIVDPTHLARY